MEWIVSRTLIDGDSGAEVVVALGRPQQVRDGEWSCAFSSDVASSEHTQQAFGVDAFQALLVAIEGVHWALSRSGRRLNWIAEPGDTCIPRLTPTSFGLAFRQRIERMLDDEIERHAEEGRRRYAEKSGCPTVERLREAAPAHSAPDPLSSDIHLARIGTLAPSELEEIDGALRAAASEHFQKLALLVATAMTKLPERFASIPDVFYAQRVIRLVKLGQLEAQGDLERMRYSEVRLSRS
jgi:hypothetical protein